MEIDQTAYWDAAAARRLVRRAAVRLDQVSRRQIMVATMNGHRAGGLQILARRPAQP